MFIDIFREDHDIKQVDGGEHVQVLLKVVVNKVLKVAAAFVKLKGIKWNSNNQ